MENLNNAGGEVSYGVNMGDYSHAVGSSMMALMTALESRGGGGGGGGGGERRIPMYSSFHPPPPPADCLVSAAAMFQAEKLQRRPVSSLIEHQLLSSEPVSSLPFVKTEEGCPYPPSRIQFHREQPVYLESTHLASPTVTSFAPHGREIESPQFSISSSTRTTISSALKEEEIEALKVKISAHPKYRSLLEAYIHCQKVGAPPDVVAQLDSIADEYENRQSRTTINVGMDPELDRFMEAYHDMLIKYEEELTKPFKEAMAFFKKIENQLSTITKGTIRISPSAESDEKTQGGGSSDEGDCGTGEMEFEEVGHHSQDRELKDRLLRKYSGYLTGLKQEFMKKKKKGKLPKDARQKLFDWWTLHSKWPYPSETEKVALAEYTGLDQKQINNWFINQRKRHWKPNDESHSEYVVMETHNPHRNAFYVERHLIPDGSAFHLDC